MRYLGKICLLGAVLVMAGNVSAADVETDISHISGTSKNVLDRQKFDARRQEQSIPKTVERSYADFKKWLADKTGLSYSIDISLLGQRGAPNGKGTPWQTQYYGSANWNMFSSDTFGKGSAQIAYTAVRYWGANANDVATRIGVINSFNDYMSKANYFDQLSYTHQFPGVLSWLSATIGQFPMYNFDGTAYNSNQQINFINYALSQNGSSTYPSASLGGYVTVTPSEVLSFTVGFQDAHNVSGSRITTKDFDKKKYTSFAGVTYTPTLDGWGSGEYSLLVYNQPSVPEQPGTSNGWSFNILQNFGPKWAVFARANGASRSPESVKQSYMLGVVCNNPFNRNALDQFGFAGAVNKLNKSVNGAGTRSVENVLEAYYAFGVSNYLTITPDIQFYINPGANPDNHTATVASLRATVMF